MGNYKFRFSDMMPNAWFYKLRDMRRIRNQKSPTKKKHQPNTSSSSSSAPQQPHHHLSTERKSYYFTRELNPNTSPARFQDPPRKSSKKKRSSNRNRVVSSTVSAGCSCRATVESVWAKPDSTPEEYPNSPLDTSSGNDSLLPEPGSGSGSDNFDDMVLLSTSCACRPHINNHYNTNIDPFDAKFELPPILTKKEPQKIRRSSAKFEERNAHGSLSVKIVKEDIINEERITTPVKRFSNSPGMKLRTNSPRIMSHRKTQSVSRKTASSSLSSRRSLSESVAVVKTSEDPHRDFKESMVEMIIENGIRTSKDLEALLACYLSLNSDEYHDMIIKVFKQIWFDVTDVRPK